MRPPMPRPRRRARRWGLALAVSSVLTACAIAPPPDRAELTRQALAQTELPAAWKFATTPGEFDAATLGFDLAPDLLALIREAQANNPDLRVAATRIDQSRSAVKAAGASLAPYLGIGGQAGDSAIPSSSMAMNGLALIVNWEIDVWGRIRRSSEAAREALYATEEFRRGVLLSLVTGVAGAYFTLLELDRVTKKNGFLEDRFEV